MVARYWGDTVLGGGGAIFGFLTVGTCLGISS